MRSGTYIVAMLALLLRCELIFAAHDDAHIPGTAAISQLYELSGKFVRVELVNHDGDRKLIHARVNPSLTRQNLICFDQYVERRPEATITLVEKFARDRLRIPISTEAGWKAAKQLDGRRSVRKLKAAGQTVESYKDQYLVMGIEQLDLTGPEVTSRLVVRSRTVPKDDPWIGRRSGQKSNRELSYQLTGSDKEYRFRIPWHENPELCAISAVEIMPPGYCYYSTAKFERGIEFFVKYVLRANGKHQRTYRGFFELDEEGYPVRGHYARAPFIDKELFEEAAQAKSSSKTAPVTVADSESGEPHDQGDSTVMSSASQTEPAEATASAPASAAASAPATASTETGKAAPGESAPMTAREIAYARAYVRGYIRDIRERLLFSRSVPEYLKAAVGERFQALQNGADRGWSEALVVTSLCRFYGIQCDKNEEQAIEDLMQLVKSRDADAMLAVVWMKMERSLRENDPQEAELAISLLKSLAEWKDPVALTILAQCYEYGDGGVPQDTGKAFELWKLAAGRGAPLGNYMMGLRSHEEGKQREATLWFKKAAEEGHTSGMFQFAERCYFGIGWGTDHDTAFYYYQKAARDGYVHAMERVADCFELGTGVDTDWGMASTWRNAAIGKGSLSARRKAAEAELIHAMFHFLATEPEAEARSLQRAVAHYRSLASESGPEAKKELEALKKVFSNSVEQAVTYVENWQSIPVPFPKLSEEELEDIKLRQIIASSSLLAGSLELQHSGFEDRPAARAIRMSQQVEEQAQILNSLGGRPSIGRRTPAFNRAAAAGRFAALWAKPLARTLYGESSDEYQKVESRCRAAVK